MAKRYEWAQPRPDKPPIELPFNPHELAVVPMSYRDDYIEIKPCSTEHMWVRSIIISGRRSAGHGGTPYYFRIENSVVWCELCGQPFIWPKGYTPERQEFRLGSAAAYYATINPERASYQGIDPSFYDHWLPPSDSFTVKDGWVDTSKTLYEAIWDGIDAEYEDFLMNGLRGRKAR